MRGKRHFLVVEIECLDTQGSRAAKDRLIRWIETFGHTSPNHGFDFFTVSHLSEVAMKGRIRKPKTKQI